MDHETTKGTMKGNKETLMREGKETKEWWGKSLWEKRDQQGRASRPGRGPRTMWLRKGSNDTHANSQN